MRTLETKSNQITIGPIVAQQNITDAQVVNLIPDIAQGTGQSNRVGNRITPTRLTAKMSLYCYNQNPGTPPTYFDMYIFKFKGATQEGGVPSAADMNLFLQADNSATQYTGAAVSGLRPINSDMFTLLSKKRVTLFNPFNAVGQISSTANVNPHRTISWNLTKHIKSTWIYDDNSTLLTNDSLYIAVGCTQTNGVLLGAGCGEYYMMVDVSYKDA